MPDVVDIAEYTDIVKPKTIELTPAQLQPYLLFLLQDSEVMAELLRSETTHDGVTLPFAVVPDYKIDWKRLQAALTAYQKRLDTYLAAANTMIAQGMGDSAYFGRRIALPLFEGQFAVGGAYPLCDERSPLGCRQGTPDYLWPVLLRNGMLQIRYLPLWPTTDPGVRAWLATVQDSFAPLFVGMFASPVLEPPPVEPEQLPELVVKSAPASPSGPELPPQPTPAPRPKARNWGGFVVAGGLAALGIYLVTR